jgi:hypothetical protein
MAHSGVVNQTDAAVQAFFRQLPGSFGKKNPSLPKEGILGGKSENHSPLPFHL